MATSRSRRSRSRNGDAARRGAGLCRRPGRARRTGRPSRQHRDDEVALQRQQLHRQVHPRPAGDHGVRGARPRSVRARHAVDGRPVRFVLHPRLPDQREHQRRVRLRRRLRRRPELPGLHRLCRAHRGAEGALGGDLRRVAEWRHRRRHQHRAQARRRGPDPPHPGLRFGRPRRRPVRRRPALRRQPGMGRALRRQPARRRHAVRPPVGDDRRRGARPRLPGRAVRAWLYLLAQTDRFDAPLRPFLLRAGVPVPRARTAASTSASPGNTRTSTTAAACCGSNTTSPTRSRCSAMSAARRPASSATSRPPRRSPTCAATPPRPRNSTASASIA